MTTNRTSKPYPAERRERAVRLVREHEAEHAALAAAIRSVAAKVGCRAETLRRGVRRSEDDTGRPGGPNVDERERIRALEREVRELRPASESLRKASAYVAQAELDRRSKPGARPSAITAPPTGSSRSAGCCRSLRRRTTRTSRAPGRPGEGTAASPARRRPARASPPGLRGALRRLRRAHGLAAARARRAHRRARCTVARLMRAMGRHGLVRGRTTRTPVSDKAAPCPLDRVNRAFKAERPNALWGADVTDVATWAGFVHVAFIIDAFARRIVGWRVPRRPQTGLVLDALEQAVHDRRPVEGGGLVPPSDRGVPYGAIKDTERLAEAGIESPPSAASATALTTPSPKR